jgi:hypothetical protein
MEEREGVDISSGWDAMAHASHVQGFHAGLVEANMEWFSKGVHVGKMFAEIFFLTQSNSKKGSFLKRFVEELKDTSHDTVDAILWRLTQIHRAAVGKIHEEVGEGKEKEGELISSTEDDLF